MEMHEHLCQAIDHLIEARGILEAGGLCTMVDRTLWSQRIADAESHLEMVKAKLASHTVYKTPLADHAELGHDPA